MRENKVDKIETEREREKKKLILATRSKKNVKRKKIILNENK